MQQTTVNGALDAAIFEELKELMCDEGPEFLIEMLGEFVTDAEQGVGELKVAAAGSDPGRVEAVAHRLKSSAAHLGAMTMSQMCERLQVMGRHAALEGCGELVASLDCEFVRVRSALELECSRMK